MRSAEEIIEKLKRSFKAPSTKDEKIKVVVFCLIISATFWFFNALNRSDHVTRISYPVSFEFDRENYITVSDLPDHILLEVSGGGWDLMTRSFGFGMEPVVIRLDDPTQSKFRLTSTLRGELVPRLEPITINFILDDSLFYDIERKITRTVALAFDSTAVVLAEDHRITSEISMEPRSIRLTGPERMINALPDPIMIDPGTGVFNGEVSEFFEIPGPDSRLITADRTTSRVDFRVEQLLDFEKELPVMKLNFDDSTLQISPRSVRVHYKVAASEQARTDSLDVMLIADLLTRNPRDSTIRVAVAVRAPWIRELRLQSEFVKVIHEK